MAYPLNMKKTIGSFIFISLYLSSFISAAILDDDLSPSLAPASAPAPGPNSEHAFSLTFENPSLERAYTALQALKKAIYSDPLKLTENWVGSDVCSYTGVTCFPALDDPSVTVVAGLDLNQGDIAGSIPPEIELLGELGFFHINSNRFCGIVPQGIRNLPLLYELDISNNRFVGPFPKAILDLPSLVYLDIRFNNFEGPLPKELFEKELDALFVNNNRFSGGIPETLGKFPGSVVVFANNHLSGCIPSSIGNMTKLDEVIFSHNNLTGCLPEEMEKLAGIQLLDISENRIKGDIPNSLCELPNLTELNFADNFFIKVGPYCSSTLSGISINETANCMLGLAKQKPEAMCSSVVGINGAIDCSECKAIARNAAAAALFQMESEPPQMGPYDTENSIAYPPSSFAGEALAPASGF